jgi:hypothetical protein
MQVEGPIPFSVAQAYGAPKATDVAAPTLAQPVQQIVAGQVAGKVQFEGLDISTAQPLQLYTRTADRIEAATRIAIGQHLDIQA